MSRSGKKTNILFLMSDQQRWDALGCVNPLVKTPHLDSLAARGIRFSQAICNAPMCVPSRYSMMLGLYPSQCGVRHNTQIFATDEDLPLPVLPQRLHTLGYQTAGFGNTHWHLGSRIAQNMPPVKPSRRGFEIRAETHARDPNFTEPGAKLWAEEKPEAYAKFLSERRRFGKDEDAAGYEGCTSELPADEHPEAWLADKAMEFLENGRNPDRPFFLYLAFNAPHPGFNIPPGYEELYDIEHIPDRPLPDWQEPPECHGPRPESAYQAWRKKSPKERRIATLRYWAYCSYVDEMFGRVLDKLEEVGEADNTFIIFTPDHGEMLGDNFHRFSKYCLYEGSIRVPLIIAGKGVAGEKRGSVDDRPAELIDVLPTLLQAAGEPAPPELPGGDLLEKSCRAGAFAEIHGWGYEEIQCAPAYMWRTRDWKLILYLPGDITDAAARIADTRGELYDLKDDPYEFRNLYDTSEYLHIREKLTRELLMHLACAWAKYPRQTARARLT